MSVPKILSSSALNALLRPLDLLVRKSRPSMDLNDLTETGIYIITGETGNLNGPTNHQQGCIMLVLRWDKNTIYQLFFAISTPVRLFVRRTAAAKWMEWREIQTSAVSSS